MHGLQSDRGKTGKAHRQLSRSNWIQSWIAIESVLFCLTLTCQERIEADEQTLELPTWATWTLDCHVLTVANGWWDGRIGLIICHWLAVNTRSDIDFKKFLMHVAVPRDSKDPALAPRAQGKSYSVNFDIKAVSPGYPKKPVSQQNLRDLGLHSEIKIRSAFSRLKQYTTQWQGHNMCLFRCLRHGSSIWKLWTRINRCLVMVVPPIGVSGTVVCCISRRRSLVNPMGDLYRHNK